MRSLSRPVVAVRTSAATGTPSARRWGATVMASALAAALVTVTSGWRADVADAATSTTLTDCSFNALAKAVAAGGTVGYGADCANVTFSRTLTVTALSGVDIEGQGHQVVFDGHGAVRLFEVNGGTLTINGVTLESGV